MYREKSKRRWSAKKRRGGLALVKKKLFATFSRFDIEIFHYIYNISLNTSETCSGTFNRDSSSKLITDRSIK